MAINTTGQPQYIKDLLDWGSGYKMSWTGNNWLSGTSKTTITYSFQTNFSETPADVQVLSSATRAKVLDAMGFWQNVANVTFSENNSSAKLAINAWKLTSAPSDGTLGITYNNFLGTKITQSEMTIQPNLTYEAGGEGRIVLIHELGHVLGLGHPADDPFSSVYNNDSTVMSYLSGDLTSDFIPNKPMIYDIAAAQFLYGANTSYNSTDTSYKLGDSRNVETIWDGAGAKDAIVANTSTTSALIDLREGFDFNGNQYYSQMANETLFLAFNANIENAIGSDGSDRIYGNALKNRIEGGSGVDKIKGYSGNDKIYGGSGSDRIDGGAGADVLYGQSGSDTFTFGSLNDSTDTVRDTIKDFTSGSDKIDLPDSKFTSLSNFNIIHTTLNSEVVTILDAKASAFSIVFSGNETFSNSDFIFI